MKHVYFSFLSGGVGILYNNFKRSSSVELFALPKKRPQKQPQHLPLPSLCFSMGAALCVHVVVSEIRNIDSQPPPFFVCFVNTLCFGSDYSTKNLWAELTNEIQLYPTMHRIIKYSLLHETDFKSKETQIYIY